MSRRLVLASAVILLASTGAVAQEQQSGCDAVAVVPALHAACLWLFGADEVEALVMPEVTPRIHVPEHDPPRRVEKAKPGRPDRLMPPMPPQEPE